MLETIKKMLQTAGEINRYKATEALERELEELQNVFALLIYGSFIGYSSPPTHITLELLPYIETELQIMLNKVDTANDPIGELFSLFDCC